LFIRERRIEKVKDDLRLNKIIFQNFCNQEILPKDNENSEFIKVINYMLFVLDFKSFTILISLLIVLVFS